MTTVPFNEADHPRNQDGKWQPKSHATPESVLTQDLSRDEPITVFFIREGDGKVAFEMPFDDFENAENYSQARLDDVDIVAVDANVDTNSLAEYDPETEDYRWVASGTPVSHDYSTTDRISLWFVGDTPQEAINGYAYDLPHVAIEAGEQDGSRVYSAEVDCVLSSADAYDRETDEFRRTNIVSEYTPGAMTFHERFGELPKKLLTKIKKRNVPPAEYYSMEDRFGEQNFAAFDPC